MLPPSGQRPPIPQGPQAAIPQAAIPQAAPPVEPTAIEKVPSKFRGSRHTPATMGTGLSPAQKRISPAEDAAFTALELEAGGREALIQVLDHANMGKDVERLVGLLADPANDGRTLAMVCAESGLSRAKFYTLLSEAWQARARFAAHKEVARHLPSVVEHVMRDAIPEARPCLICDGSGQLVGDERDEDGQPKTKPCGACRGTGLVVNDPEVAVRKLALEMGKMIDTGSKGTSITNLIANQNSQTGSGGVDFDRLMTVLDDHLYSDRRAQHRAGLTTAVDGSIAED